MDDGATRVFISYSHDSPEHEGRVRDLADRLNREGLDCVIDQYEPHPRESWRRWMQRQLENANFVLVVCTEAYFRRSRGREDAGLGLGATFEAELILHDLYERGMWNCRYVPVLFDSHDSEHIPRELRGATRYQLMRDYDDLYRHLTSQPRVIRPARGKLRKLPPEPVPSTALVTATPLPPPKLPPHYLERLVSLEELKRTLLAPAAASVSIIGAGSVGIQGMGGIGKTVLAAAVAQDREIREYFTDGVFWLPVGSQPNLLGRIKALGAAFDTLPRNFSRFKLERARSALASRLADCRLLLILDDVWNPDHALTLDVIGPHGRLLVTTRNLEVIVGLGATEYRLPLLTPRQALGLLAEWSGTPIAELPEAANEIVSECGYLPLAIAMTGAMIRLRPTAWSDALARLQSSDLERIRATFPNYPHPNLLRALEISVERLEATERERYLELAALPDNTMISEATLEVLWANAGLTPEEARDLAAALVARALLMREGAGHFRLHDLQAAYIRKRAGDLEPVRRRLAEYNNYNNGLLEEFRRPGTRTYHEVKTLLESYGFQERRSQRGHALWVHPRGSTLTLPLTRDLKIHYKKLVERRILELRLLDD